MFRVTLITGGLLAILGITVAPRSAYTQDSVPGTDAIAQAIVTESLGITAGEKVLILGPVREMQLLEDLTFHVRNQGAFPLLTITSDRLAERELDVSSRYDGDTDAFELALMDVIDVSLVVAPDMAPDLLTRLPPERLATQNAAYEPIARRFQERGIRFLEIGNSLAPTEWRARQAGMSKDSLAAMFWEGIGVDYAQL